MTDHPRIARPRVIVTAKLLDSVEARMAELFDVSFNADDHQMSREELAAAMADCDVLVPTVTDRIDADLIAAAPERLKLIANFGAGVDHIDLKAAQDKRIAVTNTPGVFTEDTADMTLALILSVPRRLAEGEKLVRSGQWKGWRPSGMLGHRVGGKTLGIIGFGRIGEAVARRARAFDLKILYNKRRRLPPMLEEELGVTFEPDLDRLVARSDIVSLHAPLTEETRGIINVETLAQMRPNAILVNTSRGPLVVFDDLIAVLRAGGIGAAGMDVFEQEPPDASTFPDLPNLLVSPHIAFYSEAAVRESQAKAATQVLNVLSGRPPDYQVN